MNVERWNPEKDGALSEAAMRAKLERRGYHVCRYLYPPGTFFPDHAHEVDKIDAVLSGSFRITIAGAATVLEAGDLIVVPRGAVHNAEVVGSEAVVSLDAVKAP